MQLVLFNFLAHEDEFCSYEVTCPVIVAHRIQENFDAKVNENVYSSPVSHFTPHAYDRFAGFHAAIMLDLPTLGTGRQGLRRVCIILCIDG